MATDAAFNRGNRRIGACYAPTVRLNPPRSRVESCSFASPLVVIAATDDLLSEWLEQYSLQDHGISQLSYKSEKGNTCVLELRGVRPLLIDERRVILYDS